ncbi:hypothetical protein ACQP2U_18965 [Nocardia sp. CA-084685]|uniref:hypothetical protein n=1 Tax=Nocardia sp. CA-084685 TaxID=3239970 RepID=UPI003D95AF12
MVLRGDRAKTKQPIATDFLDFSTIEPLTELAVERRTRAAVLASRLNTPTNKGMIIG